VIHNPERGNGMQFQFKRGTVVDWVLRIICIFILSTVASAVRAYLNINKDWDWAFFLIAFLLGFQAPKLFRKNK